MYWGVSFTRSFRSAKFARSGRASPGSTSFQSLLQEQQDCRCACTMHIPHAVQSMELISTK